MTLKETYSGKRVLVSGHSGFKGSWLVFMLNCLGADTYGFSIDTPTNESHAYYALGISKIVNENSVTDGDVSSREYADYIAKIKPDIIFHLAAQALVKYSIDEPFQTFQTNVFGVIRLLDYIRKSSTPIVTIVVTSDKCYKNMGTYTPYVETDELGGDDPYSASKAAAEIVYNSFLKSYFLQGQLPVATVRAGNVFGGGDWSEHRLIPDCVSQIFARNEISLRMPHATRPWTLVQDILYGYLLLGRALTKSPTKYSGSWNFASGEKRSVLEIANSLISAFANYSQSITLSFVENSFQEHSQLQIDASRAHELLGWRCRQDLDNSLETTAKWYLSQHSGEDMRLISYKFIESFLAE
jgi:CDP-glucose 4,6-dehydratase